jgi:hypothetical protein
MHIKIVILQLLVIKHLQFIVNFLFNKIIKKMKMKKQYGGV